MIKTSIRNKIYWLFIILFFTVSQAFAGGFNMYYEQVITDSWGNFLGYKTVKIDSLSQLPYGSPWVSYLQERMPNGKTVYEYLKDTSVYLNKPLNLTISDRDKISYSSKDRFGYNLNLFKYVTDFKTSDSRKFIALHEFGHIAMLNGYPADYEFMNLDYGSDHKHYMDEILPNHNTAWVEGWANGFAALKNDGKVFNLDMNYDYVLAFLKDNSFDEMSRNELFVAKVLYDIYKDIPDGKTKVFDVIARTGPHYSIQNFCDSYTKLYPNDKVALSRILVKNSYNKISLNELLAYVNGGSRTVSRDLYNYLDSTGKLNESLSSASSQSQQTANNTPAQTVDKPKTTTSFWGKIFNWFAKLFGFGAQSPSIQEQAPVMEVPPEPESPAWSSVSDAGMSPAQQEPVTDNINTNANNTFGNKNLADELSIAQEEYFAAFNEYNRVIAASSQNNYNVKKALSKLRKAKKRLRELKRRYRNKR